MVWQSSRWSAAPPPGCPFPDATESPVWALSLKEEKLSIHNCTGSRERGQKPPPRGVTKSHEKKLACLLTPASYPFENTITPR